VSVRLAVGFIRADKLVAVVAAVRTLGVVLIAVRAANAPVKRRRARAANDLLAKWNVAVPAPRRVAF
jgi:hypothetical protein